MDNKTLTDIFNKAYERFELKKFIKDVLLKAINEDKEFVTVGEGDSAHAIPVDYMKNNNQPRQYGGLSEEQWQKDSAEYRKLTHQNERLTPKQIKFISDYLQKALEDAKFSSENKDFNEPTREHYKKQIGKIEQDIEQLKGWFDLSIHQEKHMNEVWKKYLKEHPEEFKNNKNFSQELKDLLGEEFKNIKGQDAINKIYKEQKGYVKNAFYRDVIGNISIFWGDSKCGLKHIIEHRKDRNTDAKELIKGLGKVIERGSIDTTKKDTDRWIIKYKGKKAIISRELRNNEFICVLTAFL